MENIKDILKNVRVDYKSDQLDLNSVNADPVLQFAIWMQLVIDSGINEPNMVNLSTVNEGGRPTSRIVLLRNFDHNGFVFFTNYHSHKGRDLEANGYASMNFFWPELFKQVRIEGRATRVDVADSDEYFSTRPRESQIGAWASHQSFKLNSRQELEQKVENLTKEFDGKPVPRPLHWGGYRIVPDQFEFWLGRQDRLHDRIKYELVEGNKWKISLLYP